MKNLPPAPPRPPLSLKKTQQPPNVAKARREKERAELREWQAAEKRVSGGAAAFFSEFPLSYNRRNSSSPPLPAAVSEYLLREFREGSILYISYMG